LLAKASKKKAAWHLASGNGVPKVGVYELSGRERHAMEVNFGRFSWSKQK
jgi:hypothetical protein